MTLRYTQVPSGLLDALQEAGSVGATIQATNTSNLYRRREAMALGLNTFEDATGSTSNEFADRKYQLQPFVEDVGLREFVATGHTKFAQPRFVVAFLLIGSHNRFVPQGALVAGIKFPDNLNSYCAEGSVSIGVEAFQAGSSVGQIASTGNVLNYWPASFSDASPFLQNIAAMRIAANGADLGIREGLLEINRGNGADLDLIEIVTLTFDPSTFDRTLPVDFVVGIEQTTGATYPRWGPDSQLQTPEDSLTIDQLRLDVVGFSIFAESRL